MHLKECLVLVAKVGNVFGCNIHNDDNLVSSGRCFINYLFINLGFYFKIVLFLVRVHAIVTCGTVENVHKICIIMMLLMLFEVY